MYFASYYGNKTETSEAQWINIAIVVLECCVDHKKMCLKRLSGTVEYS